MRSRLYSMILLPILLGILSNDGPPVETGGPLLPSTNQSVIELKQPVERPNPPGTVEPARPPEVGEEPVPGDKAVLEGRVVDGRTGNPVVGAEVSVPEVDLRTVSDESGRFRLENIPPRPRTYEILVTRPGYKSYFADQAFEGGKRYSRDYPLRPVGW